ncbi:hypothetical protein ACFUTU_12020, partial [Arthrobacter sp. NPDC057388]
TQPKPGPRHTIEITTPTGHTYQSTAPPLPGTTLTRSTMSGSGLGGSALGESGPPGARPKTVNEVARARPMASQPARGE